MQRHFSTHSLSLALIHTPRANRRTRLCHAFSFVRGSGFFEGGSGKAGGATGRLLCWHNVHEYNHGKLTIYLIVSHMRCGTMVEMGKTVVDKQAKRGQGFLLPHILWKHSRICLRDKKYKNWDTFTCYK